MPDFSITDFLSVFFVAALVNNLILTQLLGVSGLFAFSNSAAQAKELATISFIVISVGGVLNGLLDKYLITNLGLPFLRLTLFTAMSAGLAVLIVYQIRRMLPLSWRRDQTGLLLAGINSAVIGLALVNSNSQSLSLFTLVVICLGSATGFSVLVLAFSAMRERFNEQAIPEAFRGAAIQLVTAGLVAMALLSLGGTA